MYTNSRSLSGHLGAAGLLVLCIVAPAHAQQQISPYASIQPADAVAGNLFGQSPVIHDGKLYVGAVGVQNGGNAGTGGVYVFDVQTLAQENYIYATTSPPALPPEQFGQSIAVQDGRVLVGSREDDPNSTVKAGAAYLFEYPSGNQLARYTQTFGNDNWQSPYFGESVALVGDVAVVGDSWGAWSTTFSSSDGTVNFFDTTTGQQVESLSGRFFPSGYFHFGKVLATWNDQLIVAFDQAPGIYFYDADTQEFLYEIVSPALGTLSNARFFGTDIAIYGDIMVASDSEVFGNEAVLTAVYVFDLTTQELIRTIRILPDDGYLGFGRTVAVNDKYLIATRPDYANQTTIIYVYDTVTGELIGELLPLMNGSSTASIGYNVILNGDTLFVNCRANDDLLPSPGDAMLAYDLSQLGATCIADTNGDGVLSPADFSAWVAAFNAMSPACDQNGDGTCTPADFSAWVANYNAGC